MQHQIDESYTKAMMQFVKLAAKWGAKPVKTTGKHLKFRDALGHQISAPKTTSDFRAIRNFKSELKNRGFIEQEKVKKVKQALEKVKTTETVPTRATSGQQTTFKDFSQKYQKDKPVRPELVRRMERGYLQSLKDLPLRIKAEIGDKIIKGLREQNIPRIVRGVSYGLKYAGKYPVPFVTTHPAFSLVRNKVKQTMPKSATAVIGIGAGKGLYDYILKPLAQQRREEQKRKRESLIPSGNQPYGTGRVAKLQERLTPEQKDQKIMYQYNQRNNPDNYLPRDPMLELLKRKKGLKTAQGNTLTPQVAQLAPIEKENQLPGRFSDTFIRLREPNVDTLKQRVKRYGNIQRMSDIYPNYP